MASVGHHKAMVLIIRAYGVAEGGTGNNTSAAAAEYVAYVLS